MTETTAAFMCKFNEMKHAKCGSMTDQIGGDIEMHFCPECLELDLQSVFALQAALTAFRASTGGKMAYGPSWDEIREGGHTSVALPAHVRSWVMYVEYKPGDTDVSSGDTSQIEEREYCAYTILTADGVHLTFRAPN